MLKVEIQITREYEGQSKQEQKEDIECFERLSKSSFPFLILRVLDDAKIGESCCGWNGTLQEFVELLELRETFGKKPDMDKMLDSFRVLIKKHNEAKKVSMALATLTVGIVSGAI